MKRVVGSPGTWSGMALRLSQYVFAAASNLALYSGFGFSNYSASANQFVSSGTQNWDIEQPGLISSKLNSRQDAVNNTILVRQWNWNVGYIFFVYMHLALILQLMWSLFLACKDIFALRNKKDLHTPDDLLFIVIIDWAMAILMFSGPCAAASLTIFFTRDVNLCGAYSRLACGQFTLSVILAFITWLLQAASSFSGFWLLVSFF